MKEIKAIVQPFMTDKVLHALAAIDGLPGVTISDVVGWGKSRAKGAPAPVVAGPHALARKTKIEIVVEDDLAERVADTIAQAARTGKAGDGKIFVYELTDAIKIRTGERGSAAI